MSTKSQLLDTTLRDGSYVINFQFTPKDTALVAAALDDANIPFIEIGHGLGMNAWTKPNMESPYSDEAHLKAAAGAVKNNKWGMFFIPGIGRLEDIELAAKYGMDFIRIGTNVTEVEKAKEYIELAKSKGMYVAANFMKTYALSPEEVGEQGKIAADYGADIVCIVDSAGGMFPEDVENYFNAIRANTPVDIGYHGHNNMGMAIANTLKAVELGCAVVDTSIRGMGRSSGNTVTEIMLLALKRRGIDFGVDVTKILDIAEQIVDPLLKNYQQVESIGIISGFAQFHSSFLGKIFTYAERYRVDPRELIVRVSEKDKINAPDALVDELAQELVAEEAGQMLDFEVQLPVDERNDSSSLEEQVKWIGNKANSQARKIGKKSVFNIVKRLKAGGARASSVLNEGKEFVIGSVEVNTIDEAKQMIAVLDNLVDYILVDTAAHNDDYKNIRQELTANGAATASVLFYDDISVWAEAVVQQLIQLSTDKSINAVCVLGGNVLGAAIKTQVQAHGFSIAASESDAEAVVCCEKSEAFNLDNLGDGTVVLDALVGSLPEAQIESLRDKGILTYRPEMRSLIQAKVQGLATIHENIRTRSGIADCSGVKIVSGGIVAQLGSVVVDNVHKPEKVIGVADGKGYLIPHEQYDEKHTANVEVVEQSIARSIFERNSH